MNEQTKKILFLTIGNLNHASSRIRAVSYFELLRNNGYQIEWIPRIGEKSSNHLFSKIWFFLQKRFLMLKKYYYLLFYKWDIIFNQRVYLPLWLIKRIKKRAHLIFDFDDAIFLYNPKETEVMVKHSNQVIVAAPVLGKYCEVHDCKPTQIISPVAGSHIRVKKNITKKDVFTIGWIGSPYTAKYLNQLENVFRNLQNEGLVFELLLIGVGDSFLMEGIKTRIIPWNYEQEEEYLHQMDVGIMPLTNDEWSIGKGGYKLYQYMAAGLPVIATPIGINAQIVIQKENGYLASNDLEWEDAIHNLYHDSELRTKMGAKSRVIFEENYAYECVYDKFLEVLEK